MFMFLGAGLAPFLSEDGSHVFTCGYGSIPIDTIFSGMNIHLPAILMFTRVQGFDPSPCGILMNSNTRDVGDVS